MTAGQIAQLLAAIEAAGRDEDAVRAQIDRDVAAEERAKSNRKRSRSRLRQAQRTTTDLVAVCRMCGLSYTEIATTFFCAQNGRESVPSATLRKLRRRFRQRLHAAGYRP